MVDTGLISQSGVSSILAPASKFRSSEAYSDKRVD